MADELLSSTDVAAMLGVTRQTVERYVREKGLRVAVIERHGRRRVYRFRRADVVEFARRWLDER